MEEQVRRTLNLISGEDLAASVPPGTQAGPGEGSERLDLRVRPREAKA